MSSVKNMEGDTAHAHTMDHSEKMVKKLVQMTKVIYSMNVKQEAFRVQSLLHKQEVERAKELGQRYKAVTAIAGEQLENYIQLLNFQREAGRLVLDQTNQADARQKRQEHFQTLFHELKQQYLDAQSDRPSAEDKSLQAAKKKRAKQRRQKVGHNGLFPAKWPLGDSFMVDRKHLQLMLKIYLSIVDKNVKVMLTEDQTRMVDKCFYVINKFKNALKEVLQEKDEALVLCEQQIEMEKDMHLITQNELLDDFEWKLREVENNYKKKMEAQKEKLMRESEMRLEQDVTKTKQEYTMKIDTLVQQQNNNLFQIKEQVENEYIEKMSDLRNMYETNLLKQEELFSRERSSWTTKETDFAVKMEALKASLEETKSEFHTREKNYGHRIDNLVQQVKKASEKYDKLKAEYDSYEWYEYEPNQQEDHAKEQAAAAAEVHAAKVVAPAPAPPVREREQENKAAVEQPQDAEQAKGSPVSRSSTTSQNPPPSAKPAKRSNCTQQ